MCYTNTSVVTLDLEFWFMLQNVLFLNILHWVAVCRLLEINPRSWADTFFDNRIRINRWPNLGCFVLT